MHPAIPGVLMVDEVQHFLQSAVHDLRAAQRRTAIAAEMLVQCSGDRERKELAVQMLEGMAKTEDLLTGIASYAMALAPKRHNVSTFPAARSVRFALANLDRQIRETEAAITVGDLPEVNGDRDRLAELFEHLIGNSLKFQGANPPVIEIRASRVPGGWQFTVEDKGIGIPAKYWDRLFIPFRRLQGAEIPGAGLGLAISRKIVESHGGRIWIEGKDSPGAIFSFVLPVADGD
jgi:light-regulated signal transduction histidine kinase (bacteriophytochrome)